MKKLLLILIFFPMIGFGQDVPLSEKKDSNKTIKIKNKRIKAKIDRKLKRELNRSLAMHPKDQIGYITNLNAHPWGGINYFHHWGRFLGWYVDYRPSMNEMHSEYTSDEIVPTILSDPSTLSNQTLWTSVTNVGLSFRIFSNKNRAIMMYGGYGGTNTKTYYKSQEVDGEYWYYEDEGESTSSENYNFGLLLQKNAGVSWQIGFDTALSGVNFGIGFSWH
ncbi:hypothetical protein OAJ65_01590 [Flavobacteriales bacterium]|nr:hypothetical protein [Flavobacteriales bacterium]